MKNRKVKLEKGSVFILAILGLLPLVVAVLEKFNVVSLSAQLSSLLVLLAGGFIMNEQVRKHGKRLFKQTSSIVLTLLVAVAVISALLTLTGLGLPAQLQMIEGILLAVVIVAVMVEMFN